MELRHLRYFVAAAELEHFGRAAQSLHIVQPALSKQIRELEEELGTRLFERLRRGVRLTSAGRGFLEESRRLLANLEKAGQRARDLAAGKSGLLRLGFVDTVMYHQRVPETIARFRQRFPEVRLELEQATSLRQAALLEDAAIDLALVYHLPTTIRAIESLVLAEEPIVVAIPPGHPLEKRRELRLADLREEPFVWIPRDLSPPFYDGVMEACKGAGFSPRIVQESRSDQTILSLVAAGVGLSFCTESARQRKPEKVRLAKIADLKLSFKLRAVWRAENSNPALASFLKQLK